MNSGGGCKEDWSLIYIEAPEAEAVRFFYNRFGHSPHRVTCTCCGEDYSVSEGESLERLSAYHRGHEWNEEEQRCVRRPEGDLWSFQEYQTVEEHAQNEDVLVIRRDDMYGWINEISKRT
jgi:hypothetical protein